MSSFLPGHINATQSLREVSLAASHSPSGQRTGNRWSNPLTCPSSSPVTNAHHPLKMVTDFHLSFWQFSAIACNNSKKKLVFGLYYISVSILTPFEEVKKKILYACNINWYSTDPCWPHLFCLRIYQMLQHPTAPESWTCTCPACHSKSMTREKGGYAHHCAWKNTFHPQSFDSYTCKDPAIKITLLFHRCISWSL